MRDVNYLNDKIQLNIKNIAEVNAYGKTYW